MSSNKDSIKQTIIVGLLLCIVCSVVVSTAAVSLKPKQEANKQLDKRKNVLAAAGLYKDGENKPSEVDELFKQFSVRFVNLDSGKLLSPEEAEAAGYTPDTYDQVKFSKDPQRSIALSKEQDIASIGRRVNVAAVYLIMQGNKISSMVLPIHGYGLWGTLYGFMALEGDANTVKGLGFYAHKETPGLGAKVDLPEWKDLWKGKQVLDANGKAAISLPKGAIDHTDPANKHKIDALSGATLTTHGVEHLVNFWVGKNGFGPFLSNVRSGEI